MKRTEVIEHIADEIIKIDRVHSIRAAIDGPDAAGKTTLAEELAAVIQTHGRPVIRASIDGFHHPAEIRYKFDSNSPESYYQHSFNYPELIKSLLAPLGPGGSRCYRPAIFNYRTNSTVETPVSVAEVNAILIFDGVFLLRPELFEYWDFTIFVESSFETILARAEQRDLTLFGSVEEVRRRYEQRYIPGQKLYFAQSRPQERASIIVDNNEPQNIVLL